MSKSTIKSQPDRVPEPTQSIHEEYGLKIIHFARANASQPTDLSQLRSFQHYGLTHLISGNAWYRHSHDRLNFKIGQGVLSSPGFMQSYGGQGTEYVEDAVSFSGPLADCLFQRGFIRDGILDIGHTRRLLPIIELAVDPSISSQIQANIALQDLLIQLHLENQSKSRTPGDKRILELVQLINLQPRKWWTVFKMAEYCDLSLTQFRRLFNSCTGMAPKVYVDNVRINHAAKILCSSQDTIATVASAFGYRDEYHFSRRFKLITSHPPGRYRRIFSLTS
jgi:AraC-like DNA-binding protein